MAQRIMIIISGAPATGKTTLSKNLAERLNIPLVNKDEIKELLFDQLGVKDTEWGVKLGSASFELVFLMAEKLAHTGGIFIVEGNFDNRYSTNSFMDIKSKFNYEVIQLYCHAEEKVLYDRYISRDNSGDRHPGHIRLKGGFEEYKKAIINRPFKLHIDGSVNIDIDTTNFENVDFEQICEKVKNICFEGKDSCM